jgi:hypothetical protein
MTTLLPERIQAKITLTDPPAGRPIIGPCWTFEGRLNNKGYGDVTFGRDRWLLHRWAYTQQFGTIPAGLDIDHWCRNTRCCNPCHLEAVTHHVNMLRGVRATQTHCKRDHELSGDNLIIKHGEFGPRRECRTCKYDSQRRSIDRRRGQHLPPGDPRHGRTGYQVYRCKCDICRAAGAAAWQSNPARLRRRPKPAEHGIIAAGATNGNSGWTRAEIQLALRGEMTSPEVARLTGRTVNAVQMMRRKLRRNPDRVLAAAS